MALMLGASLFASIPVSVSAQQEMQQIVGAADAAARGGDWAKAYPLYKQSPTLYPKERALELFKENMAYLYYRLGQSAQILGKREARGGNAAAKAAMETYMKEAIAAFTECSKIGTAQNNPQKNKVIYMIGQCLQTMGKYDEALAKFKQFESNYNKKNKTEQFVLHPDYRIGKGRGRYALDKALCHFKKEQPDLVEGGKYLEWIMLAETKAKYQIPDVAIVSAFQAYCQATKKEVRKALDLKGDPDKSPEKEPKINPKAEELESNLIKFMVKNRGMITLQPYQMYTYTPHFLKLSIEFRKLGLHKAAFVLQSFLPNTTLSKEDMVLKLRDLGGLKKTLDHYDMVVADDITKDMGKLSAATGKGEPHEMS
ncbi:MAG: hypothetical protein HRU12_05890, partial [Phaeodactylibacter sp.]|nr:hypothetical protein [Phaeodactylibacter sp.]